MDGVYKEVQKIRAGSIYKTQQYAILRTSTRECHQDVETTPKLASNILKNYEII